MLSLFIGVRGVVRDAKWACNGLQDQEGAEGLLAKMYIKTTEIGSQMRSILPIFNVTSRPRGIRILCPPRATATRMGVRPALQSPWSV